ncbi:MAG: dual specificity protein phosphatase [Polyangiales bacterium]
MSSEDSHAFVRELKGAGLTHVVSCLMEDERSRMAFLDQDFHHLFLDVHDGMYQDIAGTFSQFFDFAAAATASDPSAKLFVHREVGISRSATLAIALLMKTACMSFSDALCRVRSKRFQVLPHIGFPSQLQRLEDSSRIRQRLVTAQFAIYPNARKDGATDQNRTNDLRFTKPKVHSVLSTGWGGC